MPSRMGCAPLWIFVPVHSDRALAPNVDLRGSIGSWQMLWALRLEPPILNDGGVPMWLTVCVLTIALAIGFAAVAITLE